MEEPGRLQSMGSLRVRHDWATSFSLFTFTQWRRQWQPTPVFLPWKSHGRRSLVGYRPWGHKESDTTEWLHVHVHVHPQHADTCSRINIHTQRRPLFSLCFPGGSEVKASAWNSGNPGSIPGLGRSPGEGNGNPLQYSCMENPMERGAW